MSIPQIFNTASTIARVKISYRCRLYEMLLNNLTVLQTTINFKSDSYKLLFSAC